MRSGISPAPKMRSAPGASDWEGAEGSTMILDFKSWPPESLLTEFHDYAKAAFAAMPGCVWPGDAKGHRDP